MAEVMERSGIPEREYSGILNGNTGHGLNVKFWICCSACGTTLVLLMVSNEREVLVYVGIPSAADVNARTGIRADSVIFEDFIVGPKSEFPELQIIDTLCPVPRYLHMSKFSDDSSLAKR